MLINGEKWACDACVRGHRVSSCTHSDRNLQHINKKGRPVSQCPHCRGLRKARSSHVKCECAEKDPIKRELLDGHSCACGFGQKCTCNIKKETFHTASQLKHAKGRSRANTEGRKPRLSAIHSDPAMTVFTNGHHKPVHRNNHAGHDFAPYKIPRPHSIHGSASLAQRSMDNLSLSGTYGYHNSMYSPALPSLYREDQRLVRSAHGSPGLIPFKLEQFGQLPSLDLNFPVYNTSVTSSPSGEDYPQPFQSAFDGYTSQSEDMPPRSAPLNAPNYSWSAGDLPLDVGPLPSSYNQPRSYVSFDQSHVSGPDLTNNSSGDLSEVEDYPTQGIISPAIGTGSPFAPSPTENDGQFGSTESFQNVQNAFNSSFDAITMESFAPRTASPFDPHELSTNISPDPESFTRHGITVHDAQKLAHPGYTSAPMSIHNPITGQTVLPITTTTPTSDPSWAAAYSGIEEDVGYVSPAIQMQHQNWMT